MLDRVNSRTGNRASHKSIAASNDLKKSRYDPYDVTSFENSPTKLKISSAAPMKIKLADATLVKKAQEDKTTKTGPIKAGKLILKKSAIKLSETKKDADESFSTDK